MMHYSPRPSYKNQRERLFRYNDHPRMTEAVHYLLGNSTVYFRRPSVSQLKVGPVNFWPTTGRIHCDGEPISRQEKGLVAFANLLGLPEPGSDDDGTRARDRAQAIAQKDRALQRDQEGRSASPCS